MNLVRASLRNPYLVIVLALVILVLGVISFGQTPADLLPTFETAAIQILCLYPGMPPEVVEKDIMSRLQRWTGQSVGISHQEAKAMLGVCVVKDFFREGISQADAMSQVSSLAMSDMYYLPPGTLPPMVMPFDPTASVPLCLLSVSSETMTEKQLYDVAYFEMRNRLQAIQGVVAPAVYGGVKRQIFAYVDRDLLEARDLSVLDVAHAVQDANPFVPVGSAKMGDNDYLIRTNAMVENVKDLNHTPLRLGQGPPVLLEDVGRAADANQIQSNIVRINGRRQVYIPIYRQPMSNTLEIVDAVKERSTQILQRIKEGNPAAADLRMDVVMDQSVVVRDSLDSLNRNALIGAALVALIVLLFLGSMRSTIVVLTTIPLAMLGALAGIYFTGNTVNAMTLGGLSLAIGILVDQAVVVVENIARHLKMGKNRFKAALDGTSEVALPVLVSSLTFIVVFFPVVFLSGMAKYLFTPLAVAVTFAVITSCALSLTLVPVLASRLMKEGASERRGPFARFEEAYARLAKGVLKARYLVLVGALVLFGISALVFDRLGTELFPRVDGGQLMVLARCRPGTRLERTEEIVAEIEKTVESVVGETDPGDADPDSDLKLMISNIGVLYDWPAAYTPNAGPMDSFLLLQLKQGREHTAQEWAAKLRPALQAAHPEVEFAFDTGGMMTAALNMGLPSPIDIQIQGSKLPELHEIAQAIQAEVREIDGAADVRIAQTLDYPTVFLDVDRERAANLGLRQEEVIQTVAAALNSSVGFDPAFWIDPNNGNHYFIGAQYLEDQIESFETLENIPITGAACPTPVLLKNIATLSRTTSPASIQHYNITRTVDVYVNVEDRDLGSVAADIEQRLADSPKMQALMDDYGSRGYRYHVRGDVQTMNESFGQFGLGLGVAAILVFLVMVAQLRSFLLPLVIMLTVPLGAIGVVAALYMTGTALSIPSFMGLILMVGLVVEYSLLLVDFAVRRQREGMPLEAAIVDAARTRLRPLLMTSLTTALALIPMAMGLGRGSEANVPLARAIIGAVLGGAILSLVVVPALYGVFGRWVKVKEADAPQPVG